MAKLNQLSGRPVNVDLVRTIAMFGVVLLHAAGRFTITSTQLSQLTPFQFAQWGVVNVYQSVAVPLGVPLFLMLSGALLLQPNKIEPMRVFFKKRWVRIGLPAVFWCVAYFIWDFTIQKIPFSVQVIIQGLLNGPYTQLWYLYVLAGLYLLTPILRIVIAHADETIIRYLVAIWVVGVAVIPFFSLLTGYELNSNVFTLTGYVGFYVLGTYLSTVFMPRKTCLALIVVGLALTAVGTYALAATQGGKGMYFFQQYFSPTVILASVMVFLLLLTVKPVTVNQDAKPAFSNKIVHLISQNTLGIFFIHVMIIESIEAGYFGFTINRYILDPILEVPLLTAIVLFASLAIILLLKRVPYLNRLIGTADR